MMTLSIRTLAPLAVLTATTLPLTVQAGGPPVPDITGQWDAKIRCSGIGYDGSEYYKSKSDFEGSYEIVMQGNLIGVNVPGRGVSYCGRIAADPKKPTERGVAAMGQTDVEAADVVDSVYFNSVKVFEEKSNGQSGQLRGRGPYAAEADDGITDLEECRWDMRRVDTFVPGLTYDLICEAP